jgi:hypothetical protein
VNKDLYSKYKGLISGCDKLIFNERNIDTLNFNTLKTSDVKQTNITFVIFNYYLITEIIKTLEKQFVKFNYYFDFLKYANIVYTYYNEAFAINNSSQTSEFDNQLLILIREVVKNNTPLQTQKEYVSYRKIFGNAKILLSADGYNTQNFVFNRTLSDGTKISLEELINCYDYISTNRLNGLIDIKIMGMIKLIIRTIQYNNLLNLIIKTITFARDGVYCIR